MDNKMTLLLFSENLFWHLLTFLILKSIGSCFLLEILICPKSEQRDSKWPFCFFSQNRFMRFFWFLMSDIHENSKEQCIMGFVLKILVSICSFKVDPKITLLSFFSKSALQFYCFCICFFNNNRRLWLLKSPVHRFSFLFVLVSQKIVKWGKLGQ